MQYCVFVEVPLDGEADWVKHLTTSNYDIIHCEINSLFY